VVQEEVPAQLGGVLVTTNPMNRSGDFRNVFVNASSHSAVNVVQGSELPYQYLYNVVEGGGRTVSLGDSGQELPENQRKVLQELALCGRLLQSHFSPDYTFSAPVDIEWVLGDEGLFLLQLRPYAK
jgi:phosphoenolpyruvate synthase/pyruvate phosphate dikinase